MAVRDLLNRYDVEVVEFKGGSYSHKPLLKCDMLVVVPEFDEDNEDDNQEWIDIGKGLHEQIMVFKNQSTVDHKCDLMIVNQFDSRTKELGLGCFKDIDLADPDDYINYSCILFDSKVELGSLDQILENRFGFPKSTSEISRSSSRYKLLILSKQ
jgi:hypothetical protein